MCGDLRQTEGRHTRGCAQQCYVHPRVGGRSVPSTALLNVQDRLTQNKNYYHPQCLPSIYLMSLHVTTSLNSPYLYTTSNQRVEVGTAWVQIYQYISSTDTQTDTHIDRHRHTHTDRQRQTHTHTHRQTDRQTHRQTDRQTDTQTDRQTDRHTHMHTEITHPFGWKPLSKLSFQSYLRSSQLSALLKGSQDSHLKTKVVE